MIKYGAIEIWSKISSVIKNKICLALFAAQYKKYVLFASTNIICVLLIGAHKQGALI